LDKLLKCGDTPVASVREPLRTFDLAVLWSSSRDSVRIFFVSSSKYATIADNDCDTSICT